MTGMTVMIIHSGLLPETMNCSTIFRRLASFLGFSSVVDSAISTRRSAAIFSRSSASSMSRMASAPILAVKLSAPYSSCASRNCSSVSSSYWRERGQARIEDDVLLEVEDALDVLERHVEQQRDAATAAT